MACPFASLKSSGRTMKAVVVTEHGGPDVMKLLENHPIPLPKPTQVLIRVLTIGVNQLDAHQRAGVISCELPFIPGTDCAGIIEMVGCAVTKFMIGERVFTQNSITGTYAELTIAEEDTTYPLHENLIFSQGAGVGCPYFTAYQAIFMKGKGKPGDTLLVHGGASDVGLACCQIGRAYGMKVVATAGSPEGLELTVNNGAHEAFNHREEEYMKSIKAATGDHGVDVVCEMLADISLNQDLDLLAVSGRIVLLGCSKCRADVKISPVTVMEKKASIIGLSLYDSSKSELEETSAAVLAGIETGWLKPVIHLGYPLSEAVDAHTELVERKEGTKGKIILNV